MVGEARGNIMLSLNEILEIENTPDILEFTFQDSDILMWPTIRHVTLRIIMDYEIRANDFLAQINVKQDVNRFDQICCVVRGLIHNMRFVSVDPDIVIFSSGINNLNIDNKYINRIADHLALCYPDSSLIVENPFNWKHPKPRANKETVFESPIIFTNSIVSRFFSYTIKKKPIQAFLGFINRRLHSILGYQLTSKQHDCLFESLFRHSARIQLDLWVYEKLFLKLDPKLILFEDGCYGSRSHIIRLSKQLGIPTAEMQHGMVSRGHNAYNFAPSLLKSKQYCQHVPDYFLAYGQWWEERISIPCQKVTIGNPHRDYMVQRLCETREHSDIILILAGGSRFDFYIEMALQIVRLLPKNFRVVIRTHPGEKAEIQRKYGQHVRDIILDYSDNIYSMLAKSIAVIGEVSTGLFEAIGLTKRIFSYQSPINSLMMPDNPFDQFEKVDQLIDKLMDRDTGRINQVLEESIWARDWKNNYRNFITHEIGLNPN